MKDKSYQAVALLSGGLDSRLAIKLVLEQGIDIVALNFVSPFCTCTKKGCKSEALKAACDFKLPLKIIKNDGDMLNLVRNPKHGYGRNLNPCIDCRILMLKKAAIFMKEVGASFVVTGEVLGERPMSQRYEAIRIIERESGLENRILRPLSAHFFPPTIPEKEGLIDRGKLLSIKGRSRRPQIDLADKMGIKDYPCPAGGCLLTEAGYSQKLKRFLLLKKELKPSDLKFLRIGRHFQLEDRILIVGRNKEDNERIERLASENDILIKVGEFEGPTSVILDNHCGRQLIEKAGAITARYSQGRNAKKVAVKFWKKDEPAQYVRVEPVTSNQ